MHLEASCHSLPLGGVLGSGCNQSEVTSPVFILSGLTFPYPFNLTYAFHFTFAVDVHKEEYKLYWQCSVQRPSQYSYLLLFKT